MTSSPSSEASSTSNRPGNPDHCPDCGRRLVSRALAPYPVWRQIAFAASFVIFLMVYDRFSGQKAVLAAWCVLQAALGYALVRGRLKARHRVYRCIHCESDLG
jgi:hypothetical protein